MKSSVKHFWDARPCGVKNSDLPPGSRGFFDEVERHRYGEEFHIPAVAELDRHPAERVLEIGGGLGTDGRQYARGGSRYVDADLSFSSLQLARQGFEVFGLPGGFVNADGEGLPFSSASFDMVYSHGVLHHTPDTATAIGEVHRVLRPGGRAIVMLYAKESFTYVVGVQVAGRMRLELLRQRIGPAAFNALVGLPAEHRGRIPTQTVVNNSTDGVGNPLSKVYDRKELLELFASFEDVRLEKHYFPRRKVPLVGPRMPRGIAGQLGRLMGGFWYVKAVK